MSKDILQSVIKNFDLQRFRRFFSEKNKKFRPSEDNLDYYCDDNFSNGRKLGELYLEDGNLLICAFKVKRELSERSGKKAQYNLGRSILKDNNFQQFNAGIFVFYDQNENFRFSLIYDIPKGIHRDWNNFRRFTYFVSKEFTNKTFLQRIGDGDFSSLDKIKDAFSVEKVTKEFYKDIANWYFWAVQNVKFPKDAEAEENGRNIAVIRLITRIIFIWFMRERGLVPRYLFNRKMLNNILKDTSPEKSTYYLAILQNLFFATLNTKKTERNFHRELELNKDNNTDYGDCNGYRYHELFKDSTKISEYFINIPFLNGGLFECLDDESNGIIVDGFSDKQKNHPLIPNYLFFSGELKADLNIEYGTKNKSYKVQGLINTLSSYNFTIDENDLDDQEVALDPELLGRVFENLLASFNPETSTTARKATGSYYTPREIVDYMVTQSLKEYLKTHLEEIDKLDEKIDQLFKSQEPENSFADNVSKKIVDLIDNLRIVDPAVGSGAFPMGILNKLVFILGKLDPDNKLWKEAQIYAVKNNIIDPILRRNYLEQINEQFANKNFDYGRKLYLIQKCIYGVDIQHIAVEIAKLRFFIALLVDEKIDKSQKNWGIEPLPNLDFKIMQGNSLISEFMGINFDDDNIGKDKGQIFSDHQEADELIGKFQQKKNEFQNEPDRNIKETLKQEIDDFMIQIFETKLKKQKADYFSKIKRIEEKYANLPNKEEAGKLIAKERKVLSKNEGFDLEKFESQLREFSGKSKTKPFFAWKLYFAEVFQGDNPGFDIVIGNPPYGYRNVLTKEEKKYFRKVEDINFKSGDSAELFSKKCFNNLSRNNGFLTFIVPKKSLYGDAWTGFRKEYWHNYGLYFLLDSSKAFENVLLEQNAFGLKKSKENKEIELGSLEKNEHVNIFSKSKKEHIFMENWTVQIYKEIYPKILEKILNLKINEILVEGNLGLAIGTNYFSNKVTKYKLLKGIDVERWRIKQNRYLKNEDRIKGNDLNKFLNPKVLCQVLIAHIENPIPHLKITATYDEEGIIITNTLTSFKIDKRIDEIFWLAYLNSNFISWYAYNFIYSRAIRTMHFYNFYIKQVPIPEIVIENPKKQLPIINITNEILTIAKSCNYLNNPEKQTKVKILENQIDILIYKLYNLTPEEIEIVEGKKKE